MGSSAQKRLTDLLKGLVQVPAGLDCWVADIQQDSRRITQGALFIAAEGIGTDGADYIEDAIERGAIAIVKPGLKNQVYEACNVVIIELQEVKPLAGVIAHRFFGRVTERMSVVAVTGTNGKSSVTHYIAQLAGLLKIKGAVIGTLGYGVPGQLRETSHTTPDAITVHRCLAELFEQGYQLVALEVSSHALDQCRVAGIKFNSGTFTNLSRDHLDYHGSMASYAEAKKKLFLSPEVRPVINVGDATGRQWAGELLARNGIGYAIGKTSGAHIWADNIEYFATGTNFRLCSEALCIDVATSLLGWFNVENLLAAAATLMSIGYSLDELAANLAQLEPVCGRMEILVGKENLPAVVVDYAHTPDALDAALKTLRAVCKGQLWCVFGCGGDRDPGKRPLMGSAAESWADQIILTDDNPRNEAPDTILADILKGMREPERVRIIQPREQAIANALAQAVAEDIVLIAGKGHENYQESMGHRHSFSDREIASSLLAANGPSEKFELKIAGGWF